MRICVRSFMLLVMLGVCVNANAGEPTENRLAERGTNLNVSEAGEKGMIAHIVFFTLKDNSDEAKQKLVDACDKYLNEHEGTVYYGTGIRGKAFDRDVNVKDFDVALHLVFKDQASHDKYQDHPRHKKFIEENKDNWKQVRVFDSVITTK